MKHKATIDEANRNKEKYLDINLETIVADVRGCVLTFYDQDGEFVHELGSCSHLISFEKKEEIVKILKKLWNKEVSHVSD